MTAISAVAISPAEELLMPRRDTNSSMTAGCRMIETLAMQLMAMLATIKTQRATRSGSGHDAAPLGPGGSKLCNAFE